MSELEIIVSEKEIEGLPTHFYKLIVSRGEETNINPLKKTYYIGHSMRLVFEDTRLFVNLREQMITVNNRKIRIADDEHLEGLLYIRVCGAKNVVFESYSDISTFLQKYN